MEEKKRTLLAVVISCIIILAAGYSFGMNLFAVTPEIVLADPGASAGVSAAPGPSAESGAMPVEVTPETVQSVIAGLTRLRSYSRSLIIRYYWEGGEGAVIAQVWSDEGWTRCDATLESGLVEHSITGEETLWYWYGQETRCLTAPANRRAADLLQHIPTYEDILDLDPGHISQAGYLDRDGIPAIYVEAAGDLPGAVERYWVSVDSGLLVAAETEKNGAVVYSVASADLVSPLTEAGGAFTLPDGTVLH